MAFEPIVSVVEPNRFDRLCRFQSVTEARLLPRPDAEIDKLLSCSAVAKIGSSEVYNGEIRVRGRVEFRSVYVSTDGKNNALSVGVDFSEKIECDKLVGDMSASVSAEVIDVEMVKLTPGELRLNAIIELSVFGVEKTKYSVVSEMPDGVYVSEKSMTHSVLVCAGRGESEHTASIADAGVADVLCCESRVCVNEATAGDGSVRISGVIYADAICETADGMLTHVKSEIPFDEEYPADGASVSDRVVARSFVSSKYDFIAGDEGGGELEITCALVTDYFVFAEENFAYIDDVYSVERDLITEQENICVSRVRQSVTVTERVDGNIVLERDMPPVDNILAITGLKAMVTDVHAGEGEATVEGVVAGKIIYYSAEDGVKNSVPMELPFSSDVIADGFELGDSATGEGAVIGVSVKIRRGNELDVRADVSFVLNAVGYKCADVLTKVSEGELRTPPLAAVSIHYGSAGEGLWTASRALGVTPEEVVKQNPECEFPLEKDSRLIAYRHKSVQ